MNKNVPNQIGNSKVTILDKNYDWGIYVWQRENGKWFTDGQGNILNIPSHRGDEIQLHKLRQAAAYHGEPAGKPIFFPGMGRVTDEEYSEQVDRMKQGLIPNLNDLGAVAAAKQTLQMYGDEG
jgi:hypothetical protein